DDKNLWDHISVDRNEYCILGDPSFLWHFRLNKPVFEVGNDLEDSGLSVREKRPVAHMMLMVLWIMATPDSFRSVALRFAVSKSEVRDHYVLIIKGLKDFAQAYVKWPDQEERDNIIRSCQAISDFPGIVGIMVGYHVSIKGPEEAKAAYTNYKF
ncbi:Protein ANTAGONIST OF LIKE HETEROCHROMATIN PROTEIN 1, partial [Frankliniella fusca]